MDQSILFQVRETRIRPAMWAAIALAALLTFCWALREWPQLALLRLPDNDDMMRLAQVRDWLNGQAFSDLSQHRLGPPGGASMHWSRLADLGPAAIVALLTPLIGAAHAELAMVLIYPGLLFCGALIAGARLVERLAPGAGVTGVIVLALAFPASSLFIPGRIDHHGLQILLFLIFAERLVAPASWRAGLGAGIAAALSLVVGLEALPLLLFGMAALLWRFLFGASRAERSMLVGFALGLGGATLAALLMLRPQIWPTQWCDGFTPASTHATLIAAGYFLLLAIAAPVLRGWRMRFLVGAVLGLAALPLVLSVASVCLRGPYGAMDPMLTRLWMDNVGEALGLFQQQSWGMTLSYGGMCFAGLAALAWVLSMGAWRSTRWQALTILFGLGVLLAVLQIRATYLVSALAATPIAVAIDWVRRGTDRAWLRVLFWILGAGVTYDLAGVMLDRATAAPLIRSRALVSHCTSGDALAGLRRPPPGLAMVPLDSAAYVLGSTEMRSVGAPYHRNNSGNVALYHFFLGPKSRAYAIAARWKIDYVILCRSSFAELGSGVTRDRRRMIGELLAGRPPAWLRPLPGIPGGPMIYAVDRRLPNGAFRQ